MSTAAIRLCTAGASLLLFTGLSIAAKADTVVLKNGRRIVGESVTRENGKVICETAAGRVVLSETVVERIEKDDLGNISEHQSNLAAADLPIGPPPVDVGATNDRVIRAVIHDGSIDRDALVRFEARASN